MEPSDFWLLYNFKFPKSKQDKQNVAELKKLFDLPEARDSYGRNT